MAPSGPARDPPISTARITVKGVIPTAFRNDLFVFGEKIGNPTGDGSIGAPNYKDVFVQQ